MRHYQLKSMCEEYPEHIHARNMECSRALLDALQAVHPELCKTVTPEPKPVSEQEPEPVRSDLPPISNEEIAKAAEMPFPKYLNRISEIQHLVLKEFPNINIHELKSARRKNDLVLARQVAMFAAKQFTSKSLPEIGRRFGGRDHTTVLHAIRRMEVRVQTDMRVAEMVDRIERALIPTDE